ncbi:MAG: hypothetical protein JWO36_2605 [Myxococcales bacterium]|nr:hypothetical protein [Myxococcales bacterium]
MFPFDDVISLLFVVTLALHAVFVSYVVVGTAYVLVQVLRKRDDTLAAVVRDRLPFMLGCGITAGVAPLLFIQLLHQQRYYTANLLLGPRWLAIIPALIVGFYGLYLAKQSERWRRVSTGVALACFVFVAYSWSELHELGKTDVVWRAFYAAGDRVFTGATIAPRFIVIVGAMMTLFAMIAAWSTNARRHLAVMALSGRIISIGGAVWLWRSGFEITDAVRPWFIVLVVAVVVECAGLALALRKPSARVLAVITAAGIGALVSAAVVREAPRIAMIEPEHPLATTAGGSVVFAIAFVLGTVAIAWVVRTVR